MGLNGDEEGSEEAGEEGRKEEVIFRRGGGHTAPPNFSPEGRALGEKKAVSGSR